MLLVKNPAGANETLRTLVQGDGPSVAVVALNDGIADGRDVSWIWDVDFEPLAARLERLVVSGDRAAELGLRFAYGGLDEQRIEVIPDIAAALDRGLELTETGGELVFLPTYTAMLEPPGSHRRPRLRPSILGAGGVKITVAHLYPDYLNIYADRGNLAVLTGRARRRGIEVDVRSVGLGAATPADANLFYVGGGQDREQALIAPDLAARGAALADAVAGGAVVLAVCGGYQLLGRFYRDRSGAEQPGAGVLPVHTIAGGRRLIGDVLLECELEPGERQAVAGFENHAGRTILEDHAEPFGRVVAGFGNDGESGLEGCRLANAIGTYLHGPLLPRNPWLADWLLARAVLHATGELPSLEALPDELEREAHAVASARARSRGGRL